ncbi:unnamed protein product [Closterium sp. NIES-54]
MGSCFSKPRVEGGDASSENGGKKRQSSRTSGKKPDVETAARGSSTVEQQGQHVRKMNAEAKNGQVFAQLASAAISTAEAELAAARESGSNSGGVGAAANAAAAGRADMGREDEANEFADAPSRQDLGEDELQSAGEDSSSQAASGADVEISVTDCHVPTMASGPGPGSGMPEIRPARDVPPTAEASAAEARGRPRAASGVDVEGRAAGGAQAEGARREGVPAGSEAYSGEEMRLDGADGAVERNASGRRRLSGTNQVRHEKGIGAGTAGRTRNGEKQQQEDSRSKGGVRGEDAPQVAKATRAPVNPAVAKSASASAAAVSTSDAVRNSSTLLGPVLSDSAALDYYGPSLLKQGSRRGRSSRESSRRGDGGGKGCLQYEASGSDSEEEEDMHAGRMGKGRTRVCLGGEYGLDADVADGYCFPRRKRKASRQGKSVVGSGAERGGRVTYEGEVAGSSTTRGGGGAYDQVQECTGGARGNEEGLMVQVVKRRRGREKEEEKEKQRVPVNANDGLNVFMMTQRSTDGRKGSQHKPRLAAGGAIAAPAAASAAAGKVVKGERTWWGAAPPEFVDADSHSDEEFQSARADTLSQASSMTAASLCQRGAQAGMMLPAQAGRALVGKLQEGAGALLTIHHCDSRTQQHPATPMLTPALHLPASPSTSPSHVQRQMRVVSASAPPPPVAPSACHPCSQLLARCSPLVELACPHPPPPKQFAVLLHALARHVMDFALEAWCGKPMRGVTFLNPPFSSPPYWAMAAGSKPCVPSLSGERRVNGKAGLRRRKDGIVGRGAQELGVGGEQEEQEDEFHSAGSENSEELDEMFKTAPLLLTTPPPHLSSPTAGQPGDFSEEEGVGSGTERDSLAGAEAAEDQEGRHTATGSRRKVESGARVAAQAQQQAANAAAPPAAAAAAAGDDGNDTGATTSGATAAAAAHPHRASRSPLRTFGATMLSAARTALSPSRRFSFSPATAPGPAAGTRKVRAWSMGGSGDEREGNRSQQSGRKEGGAGTRALHGASAAEWLENEVFAVHSDTVIKPGPSNSTSFTPSQPVASTSHSSSTHPHIPGSLSDLHISASTHASSSLQVHIDFNAADPTSSSRRPLSSPSSPTIALASSSFRSTSPHTSFRHSPFSSRTRARSKQPHRPFSPGSAAPRRLSDAPGSGVERPRTWSLHPELWTRVTKGREGQAESGGSRNVGSSGGGAIAAVPAAPNAATATASSVATAAAPVLSTSGRPQHGEAPASAAVAAAAADACEPGTESAVSRGAGGTEHASSPVHGLEGRQRGVSLSPMPRTSSTPSFTSAAAAAAAAAARAGAGEAAGATGAGREGAGGARSRVTVHEGAARDGPEGEGVASAAQGGLTRWKSMHASFSVPSLHKLAHSVAAAAASAASATPPVFRSPPPVRTPRRHMTDAEEDEEDEEGDEEEDFGAFRGVYWERERERRQEQPARVSVPVRVDAETAVAKMLLAPRKVLHMPEPGSQLPHHVSLSRPPRRRSSPLVISPDSSPDHASCTSPPLSAPPPPHCWMTISPTCLPVRGTSYFSNLSPFLSSPPPWHACPNSTGGKQAGHHMTPYTVTAVDVFHTPHKLTHIARLLDLPSAAAAATAAATGTAHSSAASSPRPAPTGAAAAAATGFASREAAALAAALPRMLLIHVQASVGRVLPVAHSPRTYSLFPFHISLF